MTPHILRELTKLYGVTTVSGLYFIMYMLDHTKPTSIAGWNVLVGKLAQDPSFNAEVTDYSHIAVDRYK